MDPLLDSAPFGFLIARDDGYVEAANRTLAELVHKPVDQVVGRHIDGLLSGASRIFYQSHFFPILRLQGRVNEIYVALLDAKGEEVPVLLNAWRRDTPDGPRNDWAVVAMHTRNEYENEILKARRLAEAASTAKDAFLSFVSHELRSPLSAILNWANLLARDDADPTKMKRGLEAIERNAKLQLKLVDDMLDHARLAAGKVRVDLTQLDARPVLEHVIESLQPTAHVKEITLDSRIESGSTRVAADSERLQQIFWNLLNNAVKFTPKGGRVTVAMRRNNGWLEVEVTDTGKGIAPEFLPHVFDSFRQEEGRTVREEGGLGIGMSITRQLVELHGGTIAANSLGIGCGATFTIRLPALATHGATVGRRAL
ncbi:MAG TPA: PAS domain-containing sensor histidine kinase [Usitatibacter sp.]|nr:PAS domain-containing sensor histidine kinase [Usitatibacter sp.]